MELPGTSYTSRLNPLNEIIIEQDEQLEQLSKGVDTLKHMSLNINSEVVEQNVLLEDLDRNVDNTRNKLKKRIKAVDTILIKSGTKYYCICIVILIFILLILIIITLS